MLWRDQMVSDISGIIDNTEYSLERLGRFSQTADFRAMSDEIADMYYQAINAVVDPEGGESAELIAFGRALVMNICLNLGVDVFDDLAYEWVNE